MDELDFLRPPRPSIPEVLAKVEAQRSLMIAVATGGPRIQDVDPEYRLRRQEIRTVLERLAISDPNPYDDLWAWYGKWSSGDLPSYQSRRTYIRELVQPLLDNLHQLASPSIAAPAREPTGWVRVDRAVDKIRSQLSSARNEEDFQSVGLLCREALISLAQAVYDPARHARTIDNAPPSKTDAKRMLEAYVEVELGGGKNEAARRHAKAALDLANDLQHSRAAGFQDAALCAEATSSVVNSIAIVSGRRNPS